MLKVNASGIITTYAGGGGSLKDGIPATSAYLYSPYGVAVDLSGNLYIADYGTNFIRKVSTSGIITTIAGNGTAGFGGDGFPATTAQLNQPNGVCVDKAGNVFISDQSNLRIRKVDAAGIITTYAGNGVVGYAGDGGVATTANFNQLQGIGIDTSGNIYIADQNNNIIRSVSTSGIITRVAGTFSTGGFAGDGSPATSCQLNKPTAVATDRFGNFYIADNGNYRIRKVTATRMISTIAGCNFHSTQGYKGDGGPAVSALLYNPSGLAYDTSRNLYIADPGNNCIRKVNGAGVITTFAGNDTSGYKGDSGLAIHARLNYPSGIATDRKGDVFICDARNKRIRKVNSSGIITTYAGNGKSVYSGDGHRADSAGFVSLDGIAIDKYGNLYVSDHSGCRIRKIDTNRIITTISGTGISGYFGDGGPATMAQIVPYGLCTDDTGNLFISDGNSYRIRKIDLSGKITTVAGNGITTNTGDGGLAVSAGIGTPLGVWVDKSSNLFIGNYTMIRKINTAGIISSIAGNPSPGFYGDGSPAISSQLNVPTGLISDTSGNLLIADENNNRIRIIYNAGIFISTPRDTLCAGSTGAIFTATVSAAPVYSPYYHWQKNYLSVGTNSNTYTAASLNNGDFITCNITDGPIGPTIASSNQVTIVVPAGIPTFKLSSDHGTNNCVGTTVTLSPNSIINGGTFPIFDWYKNGVHAFTGPNYVFIPVNGDSVYCKMTSSSPCIIPDTVRSTTMKFTTFINVPTVTIISSYPNKPLCTGTQVTFSIKSYSNDGGGVFDWYKNGSIVYTGTAWSTYVDTPVNGESVYCKLTSKATCVLPDTAISNTIVLTVDTPSYPSVSISVNSGDTICPGTSVTCTASSAFGGTSPVYNWFVNGINVRVGYSYTFTPLNGDVIYCKLKSNSYCILTDTATSGSITFIYSTPVVPSVTVSVSLTADTICSGTDVIFTAASVNGGTSPIYKWYKNNSSIYTGPVFTYTSGYNGNFYYDYIHCILTSNTACAIPKTASSDTTLFTIRPKTNPKVSISFDPGTVLCAGVEVTGTATGVNGGPSPVYDWYQNGNYAFTGGQYSFIPDNSTQLYCKLTSNGNCISSQIVFSPYADINIDSIPVVSIARTPENVVFRGTEVTFTASLSNYLGDFQYQWIKNGTPIPGATDNTFSSKDFTAWDSVNCEVTVSGACNATITSNTLVVDTYHGLKLYPDPNDGDFVVNGNNFDANGDPVNIRIFSSDGKLVYEKNAAFDAITFYTEIKLGRLIPPGVYILRLRYSLENLSFHFVVKY